MSMNDEQPEAVESGRPETGATLWRFTRVVLLVGACVSLLRWAVDREPLWPVLWPLLLGAAAGGGALLDAARLLRPERPPRRIAIGCAFVGTIVTVVGVKAVNPWLAPVGIIVVMLGTIAGYEWLAQHNRSAPPCFLALGLVLLPGSTPLVAAAPVGTTVVGIGMWLIGLIALKLGVTRHIRTVDAASPGEWCELLHVRSRVTVSASIATAATGVGMLLLAPGLPETEMGPIFAVLGVTLSIGGLSAAGLAALHLAPQPDPRAPARFVGVWRGLGAAGLVMAVLGWFWVRSVLPVWGELSAVIVTIAVVTGAFFVWRGEGIVFLVLVCFLLAWVLVDRTEEPNRVAAADSEGVILALGDSFTSGQGANRYSELTNTQGSDGNTCRRSPRAFAALVGLQLNRQVLNYACNGAQTVHTAGEGQRRDDLETSRVPGPLPQLANLTHADFGPDDVADVDVVLLGIGGNDARFSTVVMACVLPPDCSTVSGQFQAGIELISDRLDEVYTQTRRAVGTDVPIVVVPYPNYVGEQRCELSLSESELTFADRFLRRLNATVARAVGDHGDDRMRFFPLMDQVYEGRQLCDDEPAANFIRLVPNEGSIFQRLNPLTWHKATMHPNDIGHRCTAAAMVPWLLHEFDELAPRRDHQPPTLDCDLAEPPERSHDDTPEELDDALFVPLPAGGRCAAGTADARQPNGCFDGNGWVADQLRLTARQLALPIGVLVVGGMFLALAIARLRLGGRLLGPFIPDPPSFALTRRVDLRPRR